MKKLVKISAMAALAVSTLGLVACDNNRTDSGNKSITFTGDYSGAEFASNTYNINGAELVLNAENPGTAKFTCPSGYVFVSFESAPSFGDASSMATCNRQGGCDVYWLDWLTDVHGFKARPATLEQGYMAYLFDNDSSAQGTLSATCVKQDQVSDWLSS